jgi:hypothetical protein
MSGQVVKLTNLGSLTLKNLLRSDDRYKDNVELKRRKLNGFWESLGGMEVFRELFSRYATYRIGSVITAESSSYSIQDEESSQRVDDSTMRVLDRYKQEKLIELVALGDSFGEIITKIEEERKKDPTRRLNRVILELTGLCNLKCVHCYRGGSRKDEYGLSVETITDALEPLLNAGVHKLMITGGEPTLRRDDLLQIIDFASQYLVLHGITKEERLEMKYGSPNPTIKQVMGAERSQRYRAQLVGQLEIDLGDFPIMGNWTIHSGCTEADVEREVRLRAEQELEFVSNQQTSGGLDQINVLSNGSFRGTRDLVKILQQYGVSLQTSLDSFNGHNVNTNRGMIGLFGRLKRLAQIAVEEGLHLSVAAHDITPAETRRELETERYFAERSALWGDVDMIQLGSAVENGFPNRSDAQNYIGSLNPRHQAGEGWCPGWTAPEDLHIKPTGVVGNCLYVYALPEEFGNLHRGSMIDIFNGIQDTEIYRMFTDGRIEEYQHELDSSIFNAQTATSCEAIVLTLTYGVIKERLEAEGVRNPKDLANRELAKIYKYAT